MNKRALVIGLSLLFFSTHAFAASSVSVMPEKIIQGDPVMVLLEGTTTLSDIQEARFDGKKINFFLYQSKPAALIGVDLHKTPGTYPIIIKLKNGDVLNGSVVINKRDKIEMPLGIPEKLGGNTTTSQNNLVSELAKENALLANIRTSALPLWTEKFLFPLEKILVTDSYGYSRKTGQYEIAHKGVDYRAKEGTSIFAMNRGIVRIAKESRTYGKMIVIDHGMGLQTFYLHLSKINVKEGEQVKRAQLIGLSGQTGYADAPHLHLSIRIGNVSIDPVKFMDFFK